MSADQPNMTHQLVLDMLEHLKMVAHAKSSDYYDRFKNQEHKDHAKAKRSFAKSCAWDELVDDINSFTKKLKKSEDDYDSDKKAEKYGTVKLVHTGDCHD